MAKNSKGSGKGGGRGDNEGEIRKGTIVFPEMTEADQPLYANAFIVNHTPWDFALHFNYVITPIRPSHSNDNFQIKARRVVTINIPPTLIRGIIKALQINLERYESVYGKIDVPKEGDQEGD